MLLIHELEEIIIPDYSALAKITKEERIEAGKKAVKKVLDGVEESTDYNLCIAVIITLMKK